VARAKILEAMAIASRKEEEEQEKVKAARQKGIEEQIAKALEHDNKDGYGGYNRSWDDKAFAIMAMAGVEAAPTDILVMPGTAGMSLDGANPAVALMSQDKVDSFKQIAATKYGPGQYDGPPPCYRKLLERMQIGTVLIDHGLLSNDLRAKGTIWHECGHKVKGEPMEAGVVFLFEIQMLQKFFSKEEVHDWCMKSPRNPEYHRTYGLAINPGRQDLLLSLKDICTEEEFYKEFRQQYQEIVGKPLAEPTSLKQSASGAEGFSGVGSIIEGFTPQLQKLMPNKEDLKGARGSPNPRDAKVGQEVKFAGKRWTILEKKSSPSGPIYKLQCTSLTETDDVVPVKVNDVWRIVAQDGTRFGLTENGPWVYTNEKAAAAEMNILDQTFALATEKFPQADTQLIIQLIAKELAEDVNI
jgi:hypothetical protein